VFTGLLGGPLRPSKFGILRHTCAALLIAEGASVKAVQAQLGHKMATMTLDTYGHLFPDETERLAERLDRTHAEALADQVRTEPGLEVVQIAQERR
jgi:integrase